MELDSTNYFFYFNRAVCYHRIGEIDKAIEDLKKTLKLNPQYKNANIMLKDLEKK